MRASASCCSSASLADDHPDISDTACTSGESSADNDASWCPPGCSKLTMDDFDAEADTDTDADADAGTGDELQTGDGQTNHPADSILQGLTTAFHVSRLHDSLTSRSHWLASRLIILSLLCMFMFSSFSSASAAAADDDVIDDGFELARIPPTYKQYYKNEWAIRVAGGDEKEADRIAAKYGFINNGRVIDGDEYFLFTRNNVRQKSVRKARRSLDKVVATDGSVLKLEQQVAKRRVKRDFRQLRRRHSRSPSAVHHRYVYSDRYSGNSIEDELDIFDPPTKPFSNPNDPLWNDMWYLHRSDNFFGEVDHNVKEAWAMGYSGRGVVVTILDDGLEHTHPDIAPNYDPKASFDVNDRDDDPMPRYDYSDENRHGTRCAGEVAAVMNNSMCVVGIAYNAKIGGIRMLDGDVTDVVEAASLSHGSLYIDIYSASWGPDDDGRTVDGPATLTRHAFTRGIKYGRHGKGSIFIWASGNGGRDSDSCNCDGYTNSIYTLSISSATEKGNIPWYSEACSSTLATAYSSGATGERMIVTTDLHHTCTKQHTGTSASAPLAAGIAALTLEANPNLSWRDLQHIVVRTAKPTNLRAGDWKINGVGRNVSHSFGYGLLDAGAMVKLARRWNSVPPASSCVITYPKGFKVVPQDSRLFLQLYSDGCKGSSDQVNYLEHVQAILTLKAPKRGGIEIYLISPNGTRSTLLAKRQRDTSRTGFTDWAFMTTHNWGEHAEGMWRLQIDNDGWDDAELTKWELVLHGTVAKIGPQGVVREFNGVNERSIDSLRLSSTASARSTLSSSTLAVFFFWTMFVILGNAL